MEDLTGRTTLRIRRNGPKESWEILNQLFFQFLLKNDLSQKTISAYQNDLRIFMSWSEAFGLKREPNSLNEVDLIEYRHYLIFQKNLKGSTVNRQLGTLKKFFLWGYTQKKFDKNISQKIKFIELSKQRSPLGLKSFEVQALLQASGSSKHGHAKRNYALVHLILQTGLRVNEVYLLNEKDIEIKDRSGIVHVRLGKGRKQRQVPLNSKVRNALQLYLEEREPQEKKAFFMSERGKRLTVRAIQAIVQGLSKRAKICRIRVSPHSLRHTFALNFLKKNPGSIVELANLMGHDSIDTTAIYTQPSIDDLALAVEKLD